MKATGECKYTPAYFVGNNNNIVVFRYSQFYPLALTVGHTPVQIYAHLSHQYLRNPLKSQHSHWTFVLPLACHF